MAVHRRSGTSEADTEADPRGGFPGEVLGEFDAPTDSLFGVQFDGVPGDHRAGLGAGDSAPDTQATGIDVLHGTWSDAELARAWASGRSDAVAEVYRRYGTAMFETAIGLLDHKVAAADAVQRTFAHAPQHIGALTRPERLRAWLFAVLRNEARELARLVPPPPPLTGVPSTAMPATLWRAAFGLDQRDREVFELHVRGGLQAADLADVLGIPAPQAAGHLTRLRERLGQSLVALTLARQGRSACPALYRALVDWDGRFTQELRSRVLQHRETCPICIRTSVAPVTAEDLDPRQAPSLPAPPPELARWLVVTGVQVPPVGWTWRDDGFPYPSQADAELAAVGGLPAPDDAAGSTFGAPWVPPPVEAEPVGRRSSWVTALVIGAVGLLVLIVFAVKELDGQRTAQPVLTAPVPSALPGASSTQAPGEVTPEEIGGVAEGGTATLGGAATPTGSRSPLARSSAADRPSPRPSPPPAPSGIRAAASSLDFGPTTASLSVAVTGYGPAAVATKASVTGPGFVLVRSSGQARPGGSVTYVVRVDRQTMPEGSSAGTLTVVGGRDTVRIALAARVEHPPVVQGVSVTPVRIGVAGLCRPTTAEVAVAYTDESVVTGVASWSAAGEAAGSAPMTVANGKLSAGLGPFTSPGVRQVRVTLTDARGNTTTADTSVDVRTCFLGRPI